MANFTRGVLDEAQRLMKEELLQSPDEGVRLLAEMVETPDDHSTIIGIAQALVEIGFGL